MISPCCGHNIGARIYCLYMLIFILKYVMRWPDKGTTEWNALLYHVCLSWSLLTLTNINQAKPCPWNWPLEGNLDGMICSSSWLIWKQVQQAMLESLYRSSTLVHVHVLFVGVVYNHKICHFINFVTFFSYSGFAYIAYLCSKPLIIVIMRSDIMTQSF